MLDVDDPQRVQNLCGERINLCADGCSLIERIGRAAAAKRLDDGANAALAGDVDDTVSVCAEDQRVVHVKALAVGVERAGILTVDLCADSDRGCDRCGERHGLGLLVAGSDGVLGGKEDKKADASSAFYIMFAFVFLNKNN